MLLRWRDTESSKGAIDWNAIAKKTWNGRIGEALERGRGRLLSGGAGPCAKSLAKANEMARPQGGFRLLGPGRFINLNNATPSDSVSTPFAHSL